MRATNSSEKKHEKRKNPISVHAGNRKWRRTWWNMREDAMSVCVCARRQHTKRRNDVTVSCKIAYECECEDVINISHTRMSVSLMASHNDKMNGSWLNGDDGYRLHTHTHAMHTTRRVTNWRSSRVYLKAAKSTFCAVNVLDHTLWTFIRGLNENMHKIWEMLIRTHKHTHTERRACSSPWWTRLRWVPDGSGLDEMRTVAAS